MSASCCHPIGAGALFGRGLRIFGDPATFAIHVDFGRLVVGLPSLLLPIVAWLGLAGSCRRGG